MRLPGLSDQAQAWGRELRIFGISGYCELCPHQLDQLLSALARAGLELLSQNLEMNSAFRIALTVLVVLCTVVLAAIFAINAIHGASMYDYAKAAVTVLVGWRLLVLLRRDRTKGTDAKGAAGVGRNTKLVVVGLAIGLGAPLVLLWIITSLAK